MQVIGTMMNQQQSRTKLIDAVIPSESRSAGRSRGTPAFVLRVVVSLFFCVAGSSLGRAAAQTSSSATPANTVQPTKPFTFEVVSIRPHPFGSQLDREYLPDGYKLYGMSIGSIISLAYTPANGYVNLSSEIRNAPAWLFTDKYDIDARVAQEDQQAWQKAVDRGEIDSPLASLRTAGCASGPRQAGGPHHVRTEAMSRSRCGLAWCKAQPYRAGSGKDRPGQDLKAG